MTNNAAGQANASQNNHPKAAAQKKKKNPKPKKAPKTKKEAPKNYQAMSGGSGKKRVEFEQDDDFLNGNMLKSLVIGNGDESQFEWNKKGGKPDWHGKED